MYKKKSSRHRLRLQLLKRVGSLSLALCLVFTACAGLLVLGLKQTSANKTQMNQLRAATSELERKLTFFDKELYSQFGLYAGSDNASDLDLAGYHVPQEGISGQFSVGKRITDTDTIIAQIRHQMGARWPLLLASEIGQRCGKMRNPLDNKRSLADQVGDMMRTYGDLRRVETKAPKDAKPGLIDGLKQKALNLVFSKYDEVMRDILPFSDSTESEPQKPDFMDNNTMVGITKSLEGLLAVESNTVTDHLLTVAYCNNYCKTAVTTRQIDGKEHPYVTFGGTELGKMSTRQAEQERLITGFAYDKASKRVESYIFYLRLLMTFIAKHMDAKTMARIDGEAVTITSAVALLTGGTVVIPPPIIRYVILIVESIIKAKAETKDLKSGKGVSFFASPKNKALTTWYGDYLLIFMLLVPTSKLEKRLGEIITEVFPNAVATSYVLQLDRGFQKLRLERGYVQWQNN